MHRDPLALRVCLGIVRLVSTVVPRPSRGDWRAEGEAEVRHRWHVLDARRHLDWRAKTWSAARSARCPTPPAWSTHRWCDSVSA